MRKINILFILLNKKLHKIAFSRYVYQRMCVDFSLVIPNILEEVVVGDSRSFLVENVFLASNKGAPLPFIDTESK